MAITFTLIDRRFDPTDILEKWVPVKLHQKKC